MLLSSVIARVLLFGHLLAAVVTLAALTHDGVLVVGFLRGRRYRPSLEQLYPRVVLIAYACAFGLGAFLYPTFRVTVRAAYLDAAKPQLSDMFEVKEHAAAIGLFILALSYAWRRRLEPTRDRAYLPIYAALFAVLYAIVCYAFVTGFVLASERAV